MEDDEIVFILEDDEDEVEIVFVSDPELTDTYH